MRHPPPPPLPLDRKQSTPYRGLCTKHTRPQPHHHTPPSPAHQIECTRYWIQEPVYQTHPSIPISTPNQPSLHLARRVGYPASTMSTYITAKAPSLPHPRNRHLPRQERITLPGAREQSRVRFSSESSSQRDVAVSGFRYTETVLVLPCFANFRIFLI